jgi:hypothetical protein
MRRQKTKFSTITASFYSIGKTARQKSWFFGYCIFRSLSSYCYRPVSMLYEIDLLDKNEMYVQIQAVTLSTLNSYIITIFLFFFFFLSSRYVSLRYLWKWWTMSTRSKYCWLLQMHVSYWFHWQSVWNTRRYLTYALLIFLKIWTINHLFHLLFSCWMQSWVPKRWCLQW